MTLALSFMRFMREFITLRYYQPSITHKAPTVTLQSCVKVSILLTSTTQAELC